MSIKFFVLCGWMILFPCMSEATCSSCTCSIAASAVNFGDSYNPLTGNTDQSVGTLTVTCSSLTPISNASFSIALNSGINSAFNPRVLESGNHFINYNIYTDGSLTQIWGSGSGGTSQVTYNHCTSMQSNAPYSCTHTFTLYGKIPASQLGVVGRLTYFNTLAATLNY